MEWWRNNMKKGGASSVAAQSSSGTMHSKIAKPSVASHGGFHVAKFADGGMVENKNPFQGDDVDPFSAVRGDDGGIDKAKVETATPAAKPEAPKKMSFKEAFASAKDGSTFEWNGKKYKKEYADKKPAARTEASKPAPKSAPKQSLAQMKGNEFAAVEAAARRAEADKNTSPAARQAVRRAADQARKTYEDAATAEKSGRSVVFKR